MNVVILGCGRLGMRIRDLLAGCGHAVTGVRRTPAPGLVAGDAADPDLWRRLPAADATVLCATPGVRRGRDHRLAEAAQHLRGRIVYTGTTAVYGDAGGAAVAEDGPLAADAAPLLAIEQAVLAHADACVLRLPALVGDGRERIAERARAALAAGQPLRVPGDPERPFAVIDEADAAAICLEALCGRLRTLRGVLNACAPRSWTLRSWYAAQLARAGLALPVVGDGQARPARMVDAGRLHRLLPDHPWR